MKIVKKKHENCHFSAVKNRFMLHGRVFVITYRNKAVGSKTDTNPETVF